jgi:hypothetical protein
MHEFADRFGNTFPKFAAAHKEMFELCNAIADVHQLGIANAREMAEVYRRTINDSERPGLAMLDELRRYAAAVGNGTMSLKPYRLPEVE